MNIFKEPTEPTFNKAGIVGRIFANIPIESTEFIIIETEEGHETTIIEHEVDFNYYILEGSGFFEINNIKQECEKGNLIVIPKGSKFTYKGKLRMLLVCTPPFYPEQEETLES
ncbi:MAG: hypothetical protein ACMG57_03005 [Candidatus Dojkabacteria bacterium]